MSNDTRSKLIRVGRAVGSKRGLSMTMDDVADEAGISKRTIFRHFTSRTELIHYAFESAVTDYGKHIPSSPDPGEDPALWLVRSLKIVHKMNLQVGRLWWDLATRAETDPTDPISAIYDVQRCIAITDDFGESVWAEYGGAGPMPNVVRDAFAAYMSVFYTNTMFNDYSREPGSLAESNASALDRILRSLIEPSPA